MTPLLQLKMLGGAQAALGLAGTLLAGAIWGIPRALSFASGSTIILTNVALIAWVLWRVFAQKTVAWTVVAIISKYALFLGSIYYLTRTPWFDVSACGLGIASFVISALVVAVLTPEKEVLRGGSSF